MPLKYQKFPQEKIQLLTSLPYTPVYAFVYTIFMYNLKKSLTTYVKGKGAFLASLTSTADSSASLLMLSDLTSLLAGSTRTPLRLGVGLAFDAASTWAGGVGCGADKVVVFSLFTTSEGFLSPFLASGRKSDAASSWYTKFSFSYS